MFNITENNLTDAIFCECTLHSTGSGTRAEARRQAQLMLAGQSLPGEIVNLDNLPDVLELLTDRLGLEAGLHLETLICQGINQRWKLADTNTL